MGDEGVNLFCFSSIWKYFRISRVSLEGNFNSNMWGREICIFAATYNNFEREPCIAYTFDVEEEQMCICLLFIDVPVRCLICGVYRHIPYNRNTHIRMCFEAKWYNRHANEKHRYDANNLKWEIRNVKHDFKRVGWKIFDTFAALLEYGSSKSDQICGFICCHQLTWPLTYASS